MGAGRGCRRSRMAEVTPVMCHAFFRVGRKLLPLMKWRACFGAVGSDTRLPYHGCGLARDTGSGLLRLRITLAL